MTTQHHKTETERLIEDAQKSGLAKQPMSVRSLLITSLIQTAIGTLLMNVFDSPSDLRWLGHLGLTLMILGVAGTLMYSADLMKIERRNKGLDKALPLDKR